MYGIAFNFLVPFAPEYKNRAEHFTTFICEVYPKFLQKLEDTLQKSSGKYLFGKSMTIADIHFAGNNFFRMSHNDQYEHSIILQVMVNQHPKLTLWIAAMKEEFKEFLERPENIRPC